MKSLCIDIGGSKCSLAILEDQKILVSKKFTSLDLNPPEILNRFSETVRSWQELGLLFTACGVGFGGRFSFDEQKTIKSFHKNGWQDFSFASWAHDNWKVKAVADNDANVAALGEYINCSKLESPFVYITLSTGVGAGIIVNGTLVRGLNGIAGELGHISLDPNGPVCGCGSVGCFERCISGYWARHDFGESLDSLLLNEGFYQKYIATLSRGLATVINLLDPAKVILGGGIINFGQKLLNDLNQSVKNQLDRPSGWMPPIDFSILGDQNVLFGAEELIKREILK